jgi:spore coat polysaccharide biosynthesis protein SpsF (cytidylyltransferase family)
MAEILAKSILAEILANKLSQLATDSTTPAFASSVKYSASHLEANQQGKQNFRRICLQPWESFKIKKDIMDSINRIKRSSRKIKRSSAKQRWFSLIKLHFGWKPKWGPV